MEFSESSFLFFQFSFSKLCLYNFGQNLFWILLKVSKLKVSALFEIYANNSSYF